MWVMTQGGGTKDLSGISVCSPGQTGSWHLQDGLLQPTTGEVEKLLFTQVQDR